MGVVFFLTFIPIIVAILVTVIVMGIVGIAVLVVGVSGSIVSVAAVSNKKIKVTSLLFFGSLLLLGLSCVVVLVELFSSIGLFVAPILFVLGTLVVALGITGIVKACGIERKPAKVIFIILLSLSIALGAIVLASGAIMLMLG